MLNYTSSMDVGLGALSWKLEQVQFLQVALCRISLQPCLITINVLRIISLKWYYMQHSRKLIYLHFLMQKKSWCFCVLS